MRKFAFTAAALVAAVSSSFAATDMTGVVNEVSGYWDLVLPVGIGILLFTIGRRAIKKGI